MSLFEFQVDLVDCFEAEGDAIVHGHVVDDGHDDVLGKGAGCIYLLLLLRSRRGMKGKTTSKLLYSLKARRLCNSISFISAISRPL